MRRGIWSAEGAFRDLPDSQADLKVRLYETDRCRRAEPRSQAKLAAIDSSVVRSFTVRTWYHSARSRSRVMSSVT